MSVISLTVGAVTDTTARVRARITGATARLAVADNPALTAAVFRGPVDATADGMVSFTADSLAGDTRYWYAIEDSGTIDLDTTGTFRTVAIGQPYSHTLVISGDAGLNPESPGVGTVAAPERMSNHPVFDLIRERNPAMFVHLGDICYYDLGSGRHGLDPAATLDQYRSMWNDIYAQPAQHELYRTVPLVYVWDDHDYGPNDSDMTAPGRDNVCLAYRERVPHYPLPAGETGPHPVYQTWRIGRVLYYLFDTRSARSAAASPPTMLGTEQKAHFAATLATAAANGVEFLVMLMPTPWLGLAADTWAGYPAERAEVAGIVRDAGWAQRCVMVSADKHVLAMDSGAGNPAGGWPCYLFASLDANPGSLTDNYDLGMQPGRNQYGTLELIDHGFLIEVKATGWIGESRWRSHTVRVPTSTGFETTFPTTPAPWRVEIAPGGDPADPTTWVWEDITDHVRIGSAGQIEISYGRPDEFATTSPTTCRLTVDNTDGRFTAHNPLGPWYPRLGHNTPLRVSWAGIYPRFVGFVTAWPPRWDQSGANATAEVEAAGITRRLTQGQKPLRSALYREITAPYRPKAIGYWPCEDGKDATAIGSAVEGVPPMQIIGAPKLAEFDEIRCSEPLPLMGDARFRGFLPQAEATGEILLRALVHIPDGGTTAGAELFGLVTTGSITWWGLIYEAGGRIRLQARNTEGVVVLDSGAVGFAVDGRQFSLNFDARQNGNTIDWRVFTFDTTDGTALQYLGSVAGTVGAIDRVSACWGRNHPDVAIGHITLANDISLFGNTAAALLGHVREPAANRIERLCTEERIPVAIEGDATATVPMGHQYAETLLDLLREAEATDGGVLAERDGGIVYYTRSTRYNRNPLLQLDINSGHLAAPPEPTDDDQALRNDVTVKQVNGAEATATDPGSIARVGRYDEQYDVNVAQSELLDDIAGWRVHLGTTSDLRWPRVNLRLHRNPELIPTWLQAVVGDRITIAHTLPQLTGIDIDLLTEGWTETLNLYTWDLELNAAPAAPWRTGIIDDPTYGRIDTDGSVLGTPATPNTTKLTVATTNPDAPRWTENPDDLPFTLQAGGEHLDVHHVAPALIDTFDRTVTAGWGQATAIQTEAFDGQTPGTPITPGGNITEAAAIYTANARHGSSAMAATNGSYVRVTNTTGATDHSGSLYLHLDTNPEAGAARTITFLAQSGTILSNIRIYGSTRAVQIADATNSAQAETTATIVAGQWCRIDWHYDDRNGWDQPAITVRFYPDADTSTYETITATVTSPAEPLAGWDIGTRTGSGTWTAVIDTVRLTPGLAWLPAEPDTGQPWQTFAGTAEQYSVSASAGRVALNTIEDRRYTLTTTEYGDIDAYARITVPITAAGGHISAGLVARWTNEANFYLANLFHRPGGDIYLQIFKRTSHNFLVVNGGQGPTYTPGTPTNVRFQCIGEVIRAKVWRDGWDEPLGWTAEGRDIAHARGLLGTHSNLNAGNTNPQPVTVAYHDIRLVNPQTLTVTRATNGVSIPHEHGTDVRLAQPLILAL